MYTVSELNARNAARDATVKAAFDGAIAAGRLSRDRNAANYAGDYMYMGTGRDGRDTFKNQFTREYLR